MSASTAVRAEDVGDWVLFSSCMSTIMERSTQDGRGAMYEGEMEYSQPSL